MKLAGTTLVIVLLSVAATAQAQPLPQRTLEARATAAAKRVSAKSLDSKLPAQPFETWFRSVVGNDATIAWEANDCGEQTGNPATTPEDFPICGQVTAALSSQRTVTVMIAVGTHKQGIHGKPAVFFLDVARQNRSIPVGSLHELPQALAVLLPPK